MGKKISLIGASNLYTNSTCVFGSMAGLAPTATVRPMFTGLPGYKFARAAANGHNWETNAFLSQGEKTNGCGLGKFETDGCTNAQSCIRHINPRGSTAGAYYKGSRSPMM
jgi:hypothetical protein